jgi:hypothetical protein
MTAVTASHLYYIKLGRGGDWEAESLRDGVLRFGYRLIARDVPILEAGKRGGNRVCIVARHGIGMRHVGSRRAGDEILAR